MSLLYKYIEFFYKDLINKKRLYRQLQDFDARLCSLEGDCFSVSGVVKDTDNNVLSGVKVKIGSRTCVSGSDGSYKVRGVLNGTYRLTATKSGYSYSGKNITISGASITGENIIMNKGTVTGYTYSGTVTDGSNPVPGVGVSVSN